jgi:hypothetical protein
MTAQTPHGSGIGGCAMLILSFVLLAPISSWAMTTPIYKCLDKSLGVVYTDEACKDGERMNIRAGDADPAAVARLERERDALDQSAAQRIADQRRAAAQRDLAAWYGRDDERSAPDYTAAYTPYDYGATGWFPDFRRHHSLRTRPPKLLEPRLMAPRPRHIGPRR